MRRTFVCALSALFVHAAAAQLVIGQTSGFTGPVAPGVQENTQGAKLWFEHVNRRGGIHGQTIELVSLDDRFQPELAVENARRLAVELKALALFMNRGTVHSERIVPLLEQHGIVLVAPSTGARSLHEPVHRWVFNVRTSYQREGERSVAQLASMGIERIALVHVDDSAGADGVAGAMRGFSTIEREPVFVHKFNRDRPDFAPIVEGLAKGRAQAVLFVGNARAIAEGTKALREAGSKVQVVTFSNNASEGFVKLLGPQAHGVIVTQVFPSERAMAVPIVKEAHDLAVAAGLRGVTPAMLEGYAGAKVLVEALRRAGPSPTRLRLRDALEGLQRLDIGGLEVTYGPHDHTGLEYVDLSIIGADRKFRR